jgi:pimeloyl-ACP methyl ester carboxylesterase
MRRARVVLVHGLWMHAPALSFWAKRLRESGYAPEKFSYKSLMQSPEFAIQKLRERVLSQDNTHVVAHSLGGLIAIHALQNQPAFNGKIICVGSPLAGSQVIQKIAKTPLRFVAGRSVSMLSEGLGEVPNGLDVSVLAGTKATGLGRLAHRFNESNDGSVSVRETQIPGLSNHLQIPVSHSGQLFSETAIQQILCLLDKSAIIER